MAAVRWPTSQIGRHGRGGKMSDKKNWDDPELILDHWYKYEQIAMHFNDLLMRFRTQALGGLTAVGTLAAVFASAKGLAASYLPAFFCVLSILWIAAWVLDCRYYSLLLSGAVKEIRRLEKLTDDAGIQRIALSTSIETRATGRWINNVHAFYGLVFVALVILSGLTVTRSSLFDMRFGTQNERTALVERTAHGLQSDVSGLRRRVLDIARSGPNTCVDESR